MVDLPMDYPKMQQAKLAGLQPERLSHSAGQLIRRQRTVNLDDIQFQTLRFCIKPLGEHGIARKYIAEGLLWVACLPDKSPLRSSPASEHCLPKLGGWE